MEKNWQDPGFQEKHRKGMVRAKLKLSIMMLENWQDPGFQEKMRRSVLKHPNVPETMMIDLFEESSLLSKFKFVGDFSFWVGGKNPDFARIGQHRKCIEMYGYYWHRGEDPKYRIAHFAKYGWKCLVIWERELCEDVGAVEKRLIEFEVS